MQRVRRDNTVGVQVNHFDLIAEAGENVETVVWLIQHHAAGAAAGSDVVGALCGRVEIALEAAILNRFCTKHTYLRGAERR